METLGQRLRRLRKGRKMTLKMVAILTGIELTLICRYEKDLHKPNVDNLARLASCLGVSMGYLYKGDE